MDVKGRAVLHIGAGLVTVVLMVDPAGYVKYLAMNGGDPQVRGASIKDDCETLRRGSDADIAIVLGLGKK